MSQTQHRAFVLTAKKGPFAVVDRPAPKPEGLDVLVQIKALAINPVDWKIAKYGFLVEEFPAILGSDGAGIVLAVGKDVTRFKVGDKIFSQGLMTSPDYGYYQEQALVNSQFAAVIPSNISFEQASTIPLGLMTAATGLFDKSGAGLEHPFSGVKSGAGKSIVVLGGSSSVGQFVIQLARLAGFANIITTASSQHTEFLKSLGATAILPRTTPASEIISTHGKADLVYDSISSAETIGFALQLTDKDVITTLPPPAPEARIHSIFGSSHQHPDLSIPLWENVGANVQNETIVPNEVEVIEGLAGIQEGLDKSQAGVSGVKLVIRL